MTVHSVVIRARSYPMSRRTVSIARGAVRIHRSNPPSDVISVSGRAWGVPRIVATTKGMSPHPRINAPRQAQAGPRTSHARSMRSGVTFASAPTGRGWLGPLMSRLESNQQAATPHPAEVLGTAGQAPGGCTCGQGNRGNLRECHSILVRGLLSLCCHGLSQKALFRVSSFDFNSSMTRACSAMTCCWLRYIKRRDINSKCNVSFANGLSSTKVSGVPAELLYVTE